jgi:biotin synthase-related radical SAM superfamily protein
MRRVGVLQGTYLAIHVGVSCTFWRQGLECRFCTTGLNEDARQRKTVNDVVETALAAKEESGVTFVHLNAGYQGGAAARTVAPYVEALKRRVGTLVGVQIAPEAPRHEFDALIDAGADHFSFCFEYMDPEIFARLCPGKAQAMGQAAFFRALEHCQRRMPKGSCSGEIIAGNEPVERTMEAIDWITSVGAFPTVCVFRPLEGSAMEHEPPPRYADMRRVMKHVWTRCRARGIPIGLAPNIEVSLVVQPTDAAYLADGTLRDRWYLWKLGLLRRLAAPLFRRRMRTATR